MTTSRNYLIWLIYVCVCCAFSHLFRKSLLGGRQRFGVCLCWKPPFLRRLQLDKLSCRCNYEKQLLQRLSIMFFILAISIATFSHPATSLPHPAITVCRAVEYDVGEYIRAVFNNFEYQCRGSDSSPSCKRTSLLRDHYRSYIGNPQVKGKKRPLFNSAIPAPPPAPTTPGFPQNFAQRLRATAARMTKTYNSFEEGGEGSYSKNIAHT